MNLFKKIFSKNESNPLLGDWFSDLRDEKTRTAFGNIKMTFTNDGKLIYRISENDKHQFINLIYAVEGNILITDQPSSPRIERTEFRIINESVLIIKYEGDEIRCIRSK